MERGRNNIQNKFKCSGTHFFLFGNDRAGRRTLLYRTLRFFMAWGKFSNKLGNYNNILI